MNRKLGRFCRFCLRCALLRGVCKCSVLMHKCVCMCVVCVCFVLLWNFSGPV